MSARLDTGSANCRHRLATRVHADVSRILELFNSITALLLLPSASLPRTSWATKSVENQYRPVMKQAFGTGHQQQPNR